MKKVCRFCKNGFKDEKGDKSICENCREILIDILKSESELIRSDIVKVLKTKKKLRYEFLDAIVSDEKILEKIAKLLFSVPAKDVGLGGPGTLAQFFCE